MNPVDFLLILRIALAVLAYAFLGVLLAIAWAELRALSVHAKARALPHGQLVVVHSGAANGSLPVGATVGLYPLTTVGRAATNDVCVPDETASAEHARLTLRGRQWWLEDLGSRSGTLLNSQLLSEATVVTSGDLIGIGQTTFRIVASSQ